MPLSQGSFDPHLSKRSSPAANEPDSDEPTGYTPLRSIDEVAQAHQLTSLATLDPKERVEMFLARQQLTFMLKIFYQWRSLCRLSGKKSVSKVASARGNRYRRIPSQKNYFTFNSKDRPEILHHMMDVVVSNHRKSLGAAFQKWR